MAAIALVGFLDQNGMPPNGIVLTAVLPGGCPLACPFCIVAARDERSEQSWLTPDHLTAALNTVAAEGLLSAVAIVGDEPLQSNAWPYAESVLDAASKLGLPMALITNGFELVDYVDRLRRYIGIKLVVSVDGVGVHHDELRGRAGAFDRMRIGLRAALRVPDLRQNLTVATTVVPHNLDRLGELLQFVADEGVRRWVLSPMLMAGSSLRIHPKVEQRIGRKIADLQELPKASGIELSLGDEFALLKPWHGMLSDAGVHVLSPRKHPNLIRIDALGRMETLRTFESGHTTGLALSQKLSNVGRSVVSLVNQEFGYLKSVA